MQVRAEWQRQFDYSPSQGWYAGVQVQVSAEWQRQFDIELERRWRVYKRRKSYRYATACVIAGLLCMAWVVYWAAQVILHRG